jgi:hypothetical protein
MKLTLEQLEKRRAKRARRLRVADVQKHVDAVIADGFARQARTCHPDAGGSHEDMLKLNKIRDGLKTYSYSVADRIISQEEMAEFLRTRYRPSKGN